MALIVFNNFANSTLANSINAIDTSITLEAGTGALFPSPSGGDYFALTLTDNATKLNHEIVYVYGRSGDLLSPVVRAKEGTTAQAWIVGDIAQNNHTAGVMASFAQLDSPGLLNTPTTPTQNIRNNSLAIASTAYADRAALCIPANIGVTMTATGVDANVSIAVPHVVISSGSISYATSLTKNLNTATTGAGGLASGVIGNTWYYAFVIGKSDGTVDVFGDTSSSPTLPSGYTFSAYIGAFLTDGTANRYPISYIKKGKKARYKPNAGSNLTALPTMSTGPQGNAVTPTWVAVSVSGFVPPTATEICVVVANPGTGNNWAVAPNNSYGAVNSTSNPPPLGYYGNGQSNGYNGALQASLILESTDIYFAASGNPVLHCYGWEEDV